MNEEKDLTIHIRSALTTGNIMFLVILSLLPALGAGLFYYGLRPLLLIGLGILTAVGTELIVELIARRPITIFDYSAAVTGFLIGLILPPAVPWYFPVIAAVVAIGPVKMAFGGIGRNLLNPAMTGKLVLLLAFREQMEDYSRGTYNALTPLTQLIGGNTIDLKSMVFGDCAGCFGTGSVIAILAGLCFLLLSGVIDLRIPASSVLAFVTVMGIWGGNGFDLAFLTAQIIGGCFLFTAVFMATDYSTSPVTIHGRVLYGLLFGILTAVFRIGGIVESACVFALLICNLTTPLLDHFTMPRPFGIKKERSVILLVPKDK